MGITSPKLLGAKRESAWLFIVSMVLSVALLVPCIFLLCMAIGAPNVLLAWLG